VGVIGWRNTSELIQEPSKIWHPLEVIICQLTHHGALAERVAAAGDNVNLKIRRGDRKLGRPFLSVRQRPESHREKSTVHGTEIVLQNRVNFHPAMQTRDLQIVNVSDANANIVAARRGATTDAALGWRVILGPRWSSG
jgi:hypothetical protein